MHRTSTTTDATGRFTLGNLQPGVDTLWLVADGYLVREQESDENPMRITVESLARLYLSVTDATTGLPVHQYSVSLTTARGHSQRDCLTRDGRAEVFARSASIRRLSIRAPGFDVFEARSLSCAVLSRKAPLRIELQPE